MNNFVIQLSDQPIVFPLV